MLCFLRESEEKMNEKYFILRDGRKIPVIGVGTGLIKHRAKNKFQYLKIWTKEQIKNILFKDFKKNNRYPISKDTKKDKMVPLVLDYYLKYYDFCLIDTARAYVYSESELGNVLRNNTSCSNTFIMSKVTNTHQRNKECQQCIDESLKQVGVKCFDLYLLHWPQTDTYIDSYKELIKARDTGKIKGIGVANFNIDHLETLRDIGLELPLVNEFECHPFLQQKQLVKYCQENGIQVIAYAPTGHKLKDFSNLDQIQKMCTKYNVESSQIIMRWHYQNGIIPIFNTTSIEHLKQNLDIFGFELTQEEMKYINSLDSNERYWPDPANCDFSKL